MKLTPVGPNRRIALFICHVVFPPTSVTVALMGRVGTSRRLGPYSTLRDSEEQGRCEGGLWDNWKDGTAKLLLHSAPEYTSSRVLVLDRQRLHECRERDVSQLTPTLGNAWNISNHVSGNLRSRGNIILSA